MKTFDYDYSHRNANDSFTETEYIVARYLIKLAKSKGFSDAYIFVRPLSAFFNDKSIKGLWLTIDGESPWRYVFKAYGSTKLCDNVENALNSRYSFDICCDAYDPATFHIYL